MLKAIKVLCRQNLVNYRKPTAFAIGESYKLPAYSTVVGMVHNACGCKNGEYIPMEIGVQGNFKSVVSDMYTRYFFGIAYDPTRHQLYTENANGGKDGITRGLGYNELLTDVTLILHIIPEREEDFERIFKGLNYPQNYLSLGRHEDLLQIESVEKVNLIEDFTEYYELKNNAYIPENIYNNFEETTDSGAYVILNKIFKVITEKKKTYRRWLPYEEGGKIMVKYVLTGSAFTGNILREENGGMGVFPA